VDAWHLFFAAASAATAADSAEINFRITCAVLGYCAGSKTGATPRHPPNSTSQIDG
jgi:hypothetical protein